MPDRWKNADKKHREAAFEAVVDLLAALEGKTTASARRSMIERGRAVLQSFLQNNTATAEKYVRSLLAKTITEPMTDDQCTWAILTVNSGRGLDVRGDETGEGFPDRDVAEDTARKWFGPSGWLVLPIVNYKRRNSDIDSL